MCSKNAHTETQKYTRKQLKALWSGFEEGERDDSIETIHKYNQCVPKCKYKPHKNTNTRRQLKVLWFVFEEGERDDRIETIHPLAVRIALSIMAACLQ